LDALLGNAWLKLAKNGSLIAATSNPLTLLGSRAESLTPERRCAELLCFLLEGKCFTITDVIFSDPARPDLKAVARTSMDDSFDQKLYRDYAIAGRK
jgi:hypothetical protein